LHKDLDVKWAAGFFEGEGYVGFKQFYDKTWKRMLPYLFQKGEQAKEALDSYKNYQEAKHDAS
jgi:hypothetical protein